MKRNAQGRVDLSLGGLVPFAQTPSTSQPATSRSVQANREVEVNRAALDQAVARFEGLDPFTRSLIEQNPLVPKIRPMPQESKPQPKPIEATEEKPKGGSLDGLFMMLGAALATGAGGLALARPASKPALSRAANQLVSTGPAPAFHIPTPKR